MSEEYSSLGSGDNARMVVMDDGKVYARTGAGFVQVAAKADADAASINLLPAVFDRSRINGGRGVLIADWSVSPVGTASTADVYPEPVFPQPAVPQGSGANGEYYCTANTTGQSSAFNSIGIWIKANPRLDGESHTLVEVQLGVANTFTDRALCQASCRADGKWRFYVLHTRQFGTAGTFTLGTTTFDFVRVVDNGQATSLTLTAGPAAGATSATLTANFATTTAHYRVRFSNNDVRNVLLTNGSTAISWAGGLSSSATTAIVYASTRLRQQTGDTYQAGPVYRNPAGRGFAFVRFDDCTADQARRRQFLSSTFTGTSGVTIPSGPTNPRSMIEIVESFGLKATLYILTRHVGRPGGFLTVDELRRLQASGHAICFQSHANPLDAGNAGLRLLGPFGFNLPATLYGSISSVDTSANTITTASAHRITLVATSGLFGDQGYPVSFFGTDLPAPLVAGTQYWLRNTTTTAFQVFNTEADSVANVNPIDLTTTGTPANFNYRYWGSANDGSAILADFRTGQQLMKEWGLNGWQHYAPNQGGWDYVIEDVVRGLIGEGSIKSISMIIGNAGSGAANWMPRSPIGSPAGGIGFAGTGQLGSPVSGVMTFPTAMDSEGQTATTLRTFVNNLVQQGVIGGNYHHYLGSATTMDALCAYCDQIKLRRDQGLLSHGTVIDAYNALVEAGVEP